MGGGQDTEHDFLVQDALKIAAQPMQHTVLLDTEVQHLIPEHRENLIQFKKKQGWNLSDLLYSMLE